MCEPWTDCVGTFTSIWINNVSIKRRRCVRRIEVDLLSFFFSFYLKFFLGQLKLQWNYSEIWPKKATKNKKKRCDVLYTLFQFLNKNQYASICAWGLIDYAKNWNIPIYNNKMHTEQTEKVCNLSSQLQQIELIINSCIINLSPYPLLFISRRLLFDSYF